MAKSSKATRGSKAKPRAAKRAPIKAQKKPAARSEASVRSAPTAKKARPAPARPASARPASAHACSEHAHELSPAYLSLREALRAFAAPVLATCTSTTARVVEQITEAIGSSSSLVINCSEPVLSRAAQVVRSGERKTTLIS